MNANLKPPLIPRSSTFTSTEVSNVKIGNAIINSATVTNMSGESVDKINSWKGYANVATTTNIVLSGIQTIDAYLIVEGDIILVKNQTNQIDNGLYIASQDLWSRSSNLNNGSDAKGIALFIKNGSQNINTVFVCTSTIATVGVNGLVFSTIIVDIPSNLSVSTLTATGDITSTTGRMLALQGCIIGSSRYSFSQIGAGTDSYTEIGCTLDSNIAIGEANSTYITLGGGGGSIIEVGRQDSLIKLYGGDPIGIQAAIPSPTENLASLKISVDLIIAAIKNIGITL